MEYFSETETCITGISQLAIYRLFCGYKTLIAPFEYEKMVGILGKKILNQ